MRDHIGVVSVEDQSGRAALGPPASRRVPALAIATWAVTAVVLGLLAAAVLHHLTGQGSGMAGMSHALYRVGDEPDGPLLSANLLTAWQLDAVADAVLALLAAGYLTAVALARRRGAGWPVPYTLSFLAGLLVCVLATNSSVAVYDMSLFTAHMIGHLMLVMLAPALLMAAQPLNLLLAATDGARRQRIERILHGRVVSLLTAPPVALASYTVVIVGTHLTGLMNQIMR